MKIKDFRLKITYPINFLEKFFLKSPEVPRVKKWSK